MLSLEQYIAAVEAATGQTQEQLEAPDGQMSLESCYDVGLSVAEAADHYTNNR
jgi:hypothetical protein